MTSAARIVMPCSSAIAASSAFNRPSTGGVRTGRRYFGHHTRWNFKENTAPAFLA